MSARSNQLAHRRESLRLRSAAQRADFARSIGRIEERLRGIDHGVEMVRQLGKKPVVLGAGAVVLAMIGPRRLFRWATRGVLLTRAARRLLTNR